MLTFSALFFALSFQLHSQVVNILDESFRDGSLPAGWTAEDINFATAAGGYANFLSTGSVLTSPVLDLSVYENVELTFDVAKFGGGADGPITVQVSNDGGATWTAQEFDSPTPTSSTYMTSGPTAITVSGENVRIRFVRTNSPSQKRFRDLVLSGEGEEPEPPAEEVTILDLPYIDNFSSNPFNTGWKDRNLVGDQEWSYNGSFNQVSMSAFSGGCQVNENWLVSPGFDLTETENELLSFDVARGFAGDNDLEVLYSINYSGLGDPNEATWTLITAISSDDFAANNVEQTFGDYDILQGIEDTVFIAFKYIYTTGECATWRVGGLSLIAPESPPALVAIGSPYEQDFSGFMSIETLPAGWNVSNSSYSGNWGAGTAAGLRGNDNVLGFQHTGGTGTFTASVTLINETGGPIEQLEVEYTGKVERVSEGRSPEWTVRVNGVVIPELFYSTDGGEDEEKTATIGGIFIPEGENVVIEWSSDRGFNAGGSSKQIGISDVSVTALEAPPLAQPVLSEQADTYFEDLVVFITNFGNYAPVIDIRYTLDGTDPDSDSPLYDDSEGILVEDGNGAVNLRVRAFNTVTEEQSAVTSVDYVFPVNIADIETLRNQAPGSTLLRLTSEATFIGGTNFRNTKFFQDDSGFGIQIDDAPSGIFNPGIIATQYEIGDNVTGIVGTLGVFQGQIQLVAALDPGPAVSSGNVVEPVYRTLDELTADDQSRLVRVNDVEFLITGEIGPGGWTTVITDPSIPGFTGFFRNVFGDSDITGSPIPEVPVSIVGVIQENNTGLNLAPRGLFDITERTKVSGVVSDIFGSPVSDVVFEMTLPENATYTTGTNGFYEFFMDINDNVIIGAEKEDDPSALVTTLDLIAIQRHILAIEPFESPYEIIASDASNDGVVSTFDLVLLQTLIVGLTSDFPAPVWRFIPASYEFDNPENPFAENFPEVKAIQAITAPVVENFVAIKTGDVVNTNGSRISNQPFRMEMSTGENVKGTTDLIFTAAEGGSIHGYQLALELPAGVLVESFIPSPELVGMTDLNFNQIGATALTNYYNGKGVSVDAGQELFRLQLSGNIPHIAESAAIDRTAGLQAEAYPVDGSLMRVVLTTADDIDQQESWNALNLSPVPTFDQLSLELNIVDATELELQIFNTTGQMVSRELIHAERGIHFESLDVRGLKAGHYFIRVMSRDHTEVLPFIKID